MNYTDTTDSPRLYIRRNMYHNTLCDVVILDKYSNVLEVVHLGLTLEQAQLIIENNQGITQ